MDLRHLRRSSQERLGGGRRFLAPASAGHLPPGASVGDDVDDDDDEEEEEEEEEVEEVLTLASVLVYANTTVLRMT